MSNVIRRRQTARQDLVGTFRYYAREAGLRVARRFFAQAEAKLARLARMPGTGALYDHDHPALAGLRYWPVSGFRKHLVFYRAVADGIEIVPVLHGPRDIATILAEEFDDPVARDSASEDEENG